MHQKKQRVWELLLVFLKIGAFTFGGGYAMIPLIQREMVDNKKMDQRKRHFGHCRDFGIDTGTDCGQCGNVCRLPCRGRGGSNCRDG